MLDFDTEDNYCESLPDLFYWNEVTGYDLVRIALARVDLVQAEMELEALDLTGCIDAMRA